jgi:hypothetical protein
MYHQFFPTEGALSNLKLETPFMKFVTLRKEKSTLTLTQSGLLAVLLEHQRRKVVEMARRRAHREQRRAAFWSAFTRLWAHARGA